MHTKEEAKKYGYLKRQLTLYNKIAKENYHGFRTVVILSGLNFNLSELEKTPRLHIYEEKFLFFLFLLRFKRTKIIFVSSSQISENLIDYYLNIIAKKETDKKKLRDRLFLINLEDTRKLPVAAKLLENEEAIEQINSIVNDKKTAYIRSYASSIFEKKVALRLEIPLYGVNENLNFYGTKSGSIKTFRACDIPHLKALINLGDRDELFRAIAKLINETGGEFKIIIKLEDYPAGEGNVIFSVDKLLERSACAANSSLSRLESAVSNHFASCCEQSEKLPHNRFSYYFERIDDYLNEFDRVGGIVETFVEAEEFYSPSCQVRILPNKKVQIISTHEQVLKGKYKTEYAGCVFPAKYDYRATITKYGEVVGNYLAKKGVIGRFAVDFIVYRNKSIGRFTIKAIEINLREGGTTHPYALARSATGALFNKKTGYLSVNETRIFYYASDSIQNAKWTGKTAERLIELLSEKKLNFNKEKRTGVIVYLFGMLPTEGRFGAAFVATSREEVDKLYKKTISFLSKNF